MLALGSILCGGLAQIVSKLALRTTDIFVLTTVRTSSALALLTLYILSMGGLDYFGAELTSLAALGGIIAWFAANILFFYIIQRGTIHRIMPFSSTSPLWGVVAVGLLLGEEAKPTILLSVVLVIFGSCFLASKGESSGSGYGKTIMLLALLVGVMRGTTIILNKYCLSGGMSPIMFLLVGAVSASVACNILSLVHHAKNGKTGWSSMEGGVGLSVLSGILGLFAGQLLW